MVADTLDNRSHTRISYAETFACRTSDICLTFNSTVECNITDNNVFTRNKFSLFTRYNNYLTAGKTFTDIVVTVTLKFHCNARCQECTETLTRTSDKVQFNAVFRKSFLSVCACDFG